MTTESNRIQKMLSRHWDGKMWHGANLKEVLSGISSGKAFAKPGAGSHNIYELVMHMICWRRFVIEHLKGNSLYQVQMNSETDWIKNYEKTEGTWNQALADLEKNQNELLQILENFTDSKLDEEAIPGRKFSWYVMIHGLLHHDIYHSAQISILKK